MIFLRNLAIWLWDISIIITIVFTKVVRLPTLDPSKGWTGQNWMMTKDTIELNSAEENQKSNSSSFLSDRWKKPNTTLTKKSTVPLSGLILNFLAEHSIPEKIFK